MWGHRGVTFVNAVIPAPAGEPSLSSLRVRGPTVEAIGVRPQRGDVVIDLDGDFLLPGLINAHDHLELNAFGRLKWRERYGNVSEWIADFQPRFAGDPALAGARPETLTDRLWIGALKNLLAGVTTVCHHNPLHGILKRGYPIGVVRQYAFSHSLGIDGSRIARVHRATPAGWPWIVHAAEGVDPAAAAEIDTLDELGCLTPNTVLVHGVALSPALARQVIARGAALVWCPSSNDYLFGATADVRPFDAAGVLALGSDSRLSGEGDLLDEIRAAHSARQIPPASLLRAVTEGAARVLRLPDAGRLRPQAPADLCVLARTTDDPLESFVRAHRRDVRLVMRSGTPLLADPAFAPVFAHARDCKPVSVDGRPRLMASAVATRAATLMFQEPGLEVAVH
jgi:cytosine/adenosine deaminase-related metal-dependent hydrolase